MWVNLLENKQNNNNNNLQILNESNNDDTPINNNDIGMLTESNIQTPIQMLISLIYGKCNLSFVVLTDNSTIRTDV